jgi:hypothetical protein
MKKCNYFYSYGSSEYYEPAVQLGPDKISMVKAEKLGRTYFSVRIKVLRGIHISRNVLFVHSLELQFSATYTLI